MPVPQRFNFIVGSRGWACSPPPTVGLFDIPAVRHLDCSRELFDIPAVRQGLKPLSQS
ncbi:hypothetical protein [Microcoleus sp. T3_D1]|uniref:hypothetical protein n=1 Tax=Microcoleus sp. T3_D1 TaxID=3055427 RepID=UPI002FD4420D